MLSGYTAHAATYNQGLSGADFYSSCEDPKPDTPVAVFCTAYINGFFEGLVIGDNGAGNGPHACVPPTVSGKEVQSIVEVFMKAHPEYANQSAAAIIATAIYAAFPCQNSN